MFGTGVGTLEGLALTEGVEGLKVGKFVARRDPGLPLSVV